ncbi:MAG: hypothetical protein ACLP7P_10805 [Rhodomicrobium sp.]
MERPDTIKRWLERLLFFWGAIPFLGVYRFLFGSSIDFKKYFSSYFDLIDLSKIERFLAEQWSILILSAIFVYLYLAVTSEQKNSVRYANEVFSPGRVPADWQTFLGKDALLFVVSANIFQFVLLAMTVDDMLLFTAVLFTFYIFGTIGNHETGKTIIAYFDNQDYSPDQNYKYTNYIQKRRDVIRAFIKHPHAAKDAIVASCCFLVFVITYFDRHDILHASPFIPHLFLVAVIISNEIVVWRWRSVRNKAIDIIDAEQDLEDIKDDPSRLKQEVALRGESVDRGAATSNILVSRKIGGLYLSSIFDFSPLVTAMIVIGVDFGITSLLMILEGMPPWRRTLYSAFLYNDTIFIPLYCAMVVVILRHAALPRNFYTLRRWHILLVVTSFATSIGFEANAIRTGQYTIAQELSPSKLWHTLIFGVVGYWLIAPLLPVMVARAPRWAVACIAIAAAGFVFNIYRDPIDYRHFHNAHLEGSYVPWMWKERSYDRD